METITPMQMAEYLKDAAKRHNIDVNKLMAGIIGDTLYLWVYDVGAVQVFRNIEMTPIS